MVLAGGKVHEGDAEIRSQQKDRKGFSIENGAQESRPVFGISKNVEAGRHRIA